LRGYAEEALNSCANPVALTFATGALALPPPIDVALARAAATECVSSTLVSTAIHTSKCSFGEETPKNMPEAIIKGCLDEIVKSKSEAIVGHALGTATHQALDNLHHVENYLLAINCLQGAIEEGRKFNQTTDD
jgi:hypothetical protein